MTNDIKPSDGATHHPKNRHLYERFERFLGVLMVAAVAVLAIGLIYGVVTTGDSTPAWMR